MIFYFADRSMNILGCAGTEVDKNYHVIDDDKEEDVENGSAILQFTMIFKDNYEADARSLTNAGNYVLLKRNRKDECYTIIYSELDKSEHSIDVYAEDAGMELINQVAPKFNHYSAFDNALENKGLKDYVPGVAAAADKWEVATYNTGEDSIIDVSALANKCYGQNGEEATAANWYIHIAYANKNQYGEVIDFSTTDSTNRKYFGNYKNTTATGSTNPDDYSWSQAKGDVKDTTTKIHIAYGDQDKHGNVYNFTTQYSLNNFRGYVGGALTAATTTQTSTETHSSDNKVLKVGDTVRIAAGARDMNYNCTFASWVYQRDYTVLEVRGNRIVFGWSNGAITGVTDAGHIIGGSTTTTTTTTTVNTPAPTDAGSYGWTSVTNKGTSSAVGVTERFTCSTGEDIGSDKHALKTNYTNYLRTYYYFNQQTRIVTQYTSDDASSLYVNGELCVTNDGDINQTSGTGKTAYMYFNKGWNIVEIVLHQLTSPCWFKFSNNPRSNANCTAQNTTSDFLDAHSVEWYFNEFAGTSGFEIGTNELSGYSQRLYWDSEDTATSRLLSVANAFNGEMCYSFEIDHMQLHHMYVNFYKKRGTETDITLRFPKEVSNIRVKTSVENLATGLYATGDTIDDQNHELTLYGYSYDDGDVYVDSDGILKSRTALKTYHRYQVHNSTGEIIKTFSYQTKSQQELFRRAFNELSTVSKPEINYEVDIQIPSKDINIGDTIRVVDEKGGIYLRARVVKLERKIYTDELVITLGDYLIEESKISKDLKALAEQFRVYVATAKTYTWFVYADDPSGTNISLNPYDTTTEGDNTIYTFRKYVGIAYNMPSPSVNLSNPEIFQWSLIKGENGIPGQKGNDGRTYYFHVAYANKTDNGTIIDFSVDDPTNRSYIGTYTDTNESDATVPAAYKWQLVKGKDGESSISHIAYCNKDASGNITDFSTTTNQNRKWIGVSVDYNDAAPTDPTKYTWAKYIGDDGYTPEVSVSKHDGVASITVKGKDGTSTTATVSDGKDGTSIKGDDAYLHIAYATSADGKTGFSTSWFSGATYLGVLSDHTKLDSEVYSDYEWSLIKGKDGINGTDGVNGKDGTGIKSVTTSYGVSDTSATRPSNWSNDVPTNVSEGSYIWVRTVIDYTDDNVADTVTYTYSRQSKDGASSYTHVAYGNVIFDENDVIDDISVDGDLLILSYKKTGHNITVASDSSNLVFGSNGEQPLSATTIAESNLSFETPKLSYYMVDDISVDGDTLILSYKKTGKNITVTNDDSTLVFGSNGERPFSVTTTADAELKFSYYIVNDFSITDNSNREWMGVCIDQNESAPTSPYKYTWTKIVGENGIDGKNGESITVKSIEYQVGKTNTTAPTGTWSKTVVPTPEGEWLWTKTTFSDNTIAYGVAKQGKSGESAYVHIKYSAVASPTDAQITEEPSEYIGICTDSNEKDPTTASSYKWTKFEGKDGAQGIPGNNGIDGKTTYVHFAYATSADGKTGFNTSWFSGATYLGVRTDYNLKDSETYTDYTWSLIKGADGHSPIVTATKTGTITTISVDGVEQATIKDGKDGKEIIGTQYYLSSSSSTRENGTWSNDVPAYKHGYTYWTRQIVKDPETGAITYTDPVTDLGLTSSNETAYEADQLAKKSVKSFVQEYYLSTSKDKPVGDEWSATFPVKRGIQVSDDGSGTVTFTKIGTSPVYVGYDSSNSALSFSNTNTSGYHEFYSVQYDADTGTLILSDKAEHTEDEWYWIRYKTTYSDGSVEYSPSENGKLLDDINELWANIIKNTTSISQTNSKVSLTATRTTSLESTLSSKADKSDIDAANDYTDKQVTEVQKQVSSLSVEADGIKSRVERNEEALGKVKYAETYLKEDGLHVSSSNYTTESTVDGHGMMVKDQNGNVLAQFTTGESQIQNVKITGHIKMGAHEVYKMNDTEWDGSTAAGTGFMWTGGN